MPRLNVASAYSQAPTLVTETHLVSPVSALEDVSPISPLQNVSPISRSPSPSSLVTQRAGSLGRSRRSSPLSTQQPGLATSSRQVTVHRPRAESLKVPNTAPSCSTDTYDGYGVRTASDQPPNPYRDSNPFTSLLSFEAQGLCSGVSDSPDLQSDTDSTVPKPFAHNSQQPMYPLTGDTLPYGSTNLDFGSATNDWAALLSNAPPHVDLREEQPPPGYLTQFEHMRRREDLDLTDPQLRVHTTASLDEVYGGLTPYQVSSYSIGARMMGMPAETALAQLNAAKNIP